MKHPLIFLVPLMFTALFWTSLLPVPVNVDKLNEDFEELYTEFTPLRVMFIQAKNKQTKTAESVSIPAQRVGEKSNDLEARKTVAEREKIFQLNRFETKFLTPCNKFRRINLLSRLESDLRLGVIGRKGEKKARRMTPSELALAFKQNYVGDAMAYWGHDRSYQDLLEYGEKAVENAKTNLAKLELEVIDSRTAVSLEKFQRLHVAKFSNEDDIIAAFHARQTVMEKNLTKFFYDYDVPEPSIRGRVNKKTLYAIGTYDQRKGVFVFHWDGEVFLGKDLDYLLIHELVPGHHLQTSVHRKFPICSGLGDRKRVRLSTSHSSFVEGWATYIETLGPELGMSQTFEQRLGKLDWDLVRSIRIILDARIHRDGWTDEKVKAYWIQHLPHRLHQLADREIRRMRRMPMQTLAYKFGADAILELRAKEEARLGTNFDIRVFHDKLLRIGPVRLDILEDSFYVFP